MTWEWKIGDPVDDSNGGSMDAQNWGHGNYDDDERTGFASDSHDSRMAEYSKKAWDYYLEYMNEKALHYINLALDLNDRNAENWNRKAIILEDMKRFDEAERCYNRSLELSRSNVVYDNRARMLYRWAVQLREDSKDLNDGTAMLHEAYDKCIKAINSLPGEDSEEDLEKYLKLRDSINFYIDYERKYQENVESLKEYAKSELFTIAGNRYYRHGQALTRGMPLRLVREPDNEFDSDAIAVYADGEKIGYVANSDRTRFKMTSSASELKDKIGNGVQASYLFYLDRYCEVQFHIARIVEWGDLMKCPFCGENLIEGDLICPGCGGLAVDFDYPENMERMEEKYCKSSLLDLSREKLTFEEIVTVYTYIERADHHGGDGEVSDECSRDGTFSNLSDRLREIKNAER